MPFLNSGKRDILEGAVALSADAAAGRIFVILVSASHTPDIDTVLRYRDISAHEISIADPGRTVGYFSGGLALSAGVAFVTDNSNDRGTFDANDSTWTSSTIAARYAYILKIRAGGLNKENDNAIAYIDFGSTQSSSNGSFTIQWNASGILALS